MLIKCRAENLFRSKKDIKYRNKSDGGLIDADLNVTDNLLRRFISSILHFFL